ncbi:MAG: zinc ribbon domain-containing protein [Ruminococcus sp.]|nr:zinc ribbon domain-containing protein [Ruminococcus sp.]
MKKCVSCGCENEDSAAFCKECGAESPKEKVNVFPQAKVVAEDGSMEVGGFRFRPVPDEEIRALVNQKTPLSTKIIAGAVTAALVIGFTAMAAAVRGSQRPNQLDMIIREDKTVFLFNGERVDGSVDTVSEYDYCEAHDESAAIFHNLKSGKLYAVTKDGVERIAKDAEEAYISVYGDYILYTDEDGYGYSYNVKKGKNEKISGGFQLESAVVSPDGETVVFNKYGGDSLYMYEGGYCEKIGSGMKAIAVSDNAKHLYAVEYLAEPTLPEGVEKPDSSDYDEYDDYKKAYDEYKEYAEKLEEQMDEYREFDSEDVALYYIPEAKEDKAVKLEKHFNTISSVYLNGDFSEILYSNTDGETYYSKKGKDTERISKNSLTPACWYSSDMIVLSSKANMLDENGSLLGRAYIDAGVEFVMFSFGDEEDRETYNEGSAIYYVDKNGDVDSIDDDIDVTSIELSENGKKIYYLDNDSKLYVSDTETGDDKERIGKDILSYVVEDDFSGVYAVDVDGNFYYISDDGEKERIDKQIKYCCNALGGGVYYMDNDNKLYKAEKGEKGDRIAKDVEYIKSGNCCTYYLKYEDEDSELFEVYVSYDGKEFEKVCSDCTKDGYIELF